MVEPGPGNFPGKCIKFGREKLYEELRKLFKEYLDQSKAPEDWNTYITTIDKEGDKRKCEHYHLQRYEKYIWRKLRRFGLKLVQIISICGC